MLEKKKSRGVEAINYPPYLTESNELAVSYKPNSDIVDF